MPEESIDLIREALRGFESRDFAGVRPLLHPHCWISGPEGWPEPGPFRGRDAAIGQFRRLAGEWEENRISDLEVLVDRGDWVVVTFRWMVRSEEGAAPFAANFSAAYRVEGGQIWEAHFRWTPEQALEAAALSD